MFVNPDSATIMKKHSFVFFGETWLTEANHSPYDLPGKVNFAHHAIKNKTKGRPSAGQEWYGSSKYEPHFISSSDHHLTIKFSDFTIVGVYFRPSMDMDVIISTLIEEMDKAPNKHRIIVGGDFNVHPDFERFSEIRELL